MGMQHLAPQFFDKPFMLSDYEIKDLRAVCRQIFDDTTLGDYKGYLDNALEECMIGDNAPFDDSESRRDAFGYTFMIHKALDVVKYIADGVGVPAVHTSAEELDERYQDVENLAFKDLQAALQHFMARQSFFSEKSSLMMLQSSMTLRRILASERRKLPGGE